MNPIQRRRTILRIVREREIGTQQELVRALREEGFPVSQSSVSRDMAALGLVKSGGRYVAPAAGRPAANPHEERIRDFVLAAAPAGPHLVVIHTPPGEAQGVGLALDRLAPRGMVGTVAGDDTILAAVEDQEAQRELLRRLRALAAPRGEGGRT